MKSKIVHSFFILVVISFCYVCKGGSGTTQNTNGSTTNTNTEGIAPTNAPNDRKIKKLNDIAKFIAGLQLDNTSELYNLTVTPEWKAYSSEAQTAWDKFKKVSDQCISWRSKELPKAGESFETLFYPFGGPDYLFANIFFPGAHNYIMIGLEDPGSVPQVEAFTKADLKKILSLYKSAIEDVIQLSFFRTNDMKVELTTKAIDGTAPIIMLFLARSGKQITDIQPMVLNQEGNLIPATGNTKHTAIGITFRTPGDTVSRHVYYLSTNLADPALNQNISFRKFLNKIDDKSFSFVKSATYLMHKSYFSVIRNTVLNKSTVILQDDSGIAYKFFDKSKWKISLYGTYEKPINLFKDFYEPDLFEAYKKNAKPLDFRIGYNTKSHLLVAEKTKN